MFESSDAFVDVQLWQIFTGAKVRWKDGFYQERLARDANVVKPFAGPVEKPPRLEKWASQIEKVIFVYCDLISGYNLGFWSCFVEWATMSNELLFFLT